MTLNARPPQPAAGRTADYSRRLVHVPILHSPADMGGLADGMAAAIIEQFGRRHWEDYLALLNGFWQAVRAEIETLGLDYPLVDLYQDGLPVCGRELVIVTKAAAAGSENHQLLLYLAGRGARVIGTEDPKLLLDEYHDMKAALGEGGTGLQPLSGAGGTRCKPVPQEDTGYKPVLPETSPHRQRLAKRDAYIGGRIGATLRPGRTGILFLGMMHNVEPFLPADIVATRLVPRGLDRLDQVARPFLTEHAGKNARVTSPPKKEETRSCPQSK